jgi:plastocyanin
MSGEATAAGILADGMNLVRAGAVHRIKSSTEVSMVPAMRFALALFVSLVVLAAAPAMAADKTVQVGDNFFAPTSTTVEPGDTVTWDWVGSDEHTAQSHTKQIDSFNSQPMSGSSASFQHTFKYRGRFRYFCQFHPDEMEATVQVGAKDTVKPKLSRLKAKVSGSTVKLTFKVSERSVVTVKVGRKKKVVKAGRRSVKFKGLSDGRHKAKFSAKDGFGNTGKKSKSFTTG